jgi:hypothetical protein
MTAAFLLRVRPRDEVDDVEEKRMRVSELAVLIGERDSVGREDLREIATFEGGFADALIELGQKRDHLALLDVRLVCGEDERLESLDRDADALRGGRKLGDARDELMDEVERFAEACDRRDLCKSLADALDGAG